MHHEDSVQACPISAEKQQCVSGEVFAGGGVSSIITLAASLSQAFYLPGRRRVEKQDDSGWPIPHVKRLHSN